MALSNENIKISEVKDSIRQSFLQEINSILIDLYLDSSSVPLDDSASVDELYNRYKDEDGNLYLEVSFRKRLDWWKIWRNKHGQVNFYFPPGQTGIFRRR